MTQFNESEKSSKETNNYNKLCVYVQLLCNNGFRFPLSGQRQQCVNIEPATRFFGNLKQHFFGLWKRKKTSKFRYYDFFFIFFMNV